MRKNNLSLTKMLTIIGVVVGIVGGIVTIIYTIITNSRPDFLVSVSSLEGNVEPGGTVQCDVTVKHLKGYRNYLVGLDVDGGTLPDGINLAFVPPDDRKPNYTAQLTISVGKNAQAGKYELLIKGMGSTGNESTCKYTLNVGSSGTTTISDPPWIFGNTAGNINNGSLLASSDGWIYYSNYAESGKLYKTRVDGSEKIKLNEDKSSSINILGEWIYYRNESDNNKIYKIKTDGTGRVSLSDDPCDNIVAVGDWIFYSTDYGEGVICVMKTDGSGKADIERISLFQEDDKARTGMIHGLNVSREWIYYYYLSYYLGDDGTVYLSPVGLRKHSINGTEKATLEYVNDAFIVDNGYIYFSNGNDGGKLYRMTEDEAARQKLNDDESYYLNVADDWIYYSNESDGQKLYRVRTDGSGREKLNDDPSYFINVGAGWVFYMNRTDNILYRIKIDGTARETVN